MKYRKGKVGMQRHPASYESPETLIDPVMTTVTEELAMWKAAEKIVKVLDKRFSTAQTFFIWHYVNHLRGMDNLEELKWMEFMKFRLYYSRFVDKMKKDGVKL